MIVSITERDIQQGRPFEPEQCPVALAMRRAMPHVHSVVNAGYLTIEGERYMWPDQVRNFIARFDGGIATKPFEFDTAWLESLDD